MNSKITYKYEKSLIERQWEAEMQMLAEFEAGSFSPEETVEESGLLSGRIGRTGESELPVCPHPVSIMETVSRRGTAVCRNCR